MGLDVRRWIIIRRASAGSREDSMSVEAVDLSAVGRVAARSVMGAVILVDADSGVVFADGVLLERCGYRAGDWLGRPIFEVFEGGLLAGLESHYRAAFLGVEQEFEFCSDDGQVVYRAQIVPVCGEDGVITSVVTVLDDMSGRPGVIEQRSNGVTLLGDAERLALVAEKRDVHRDRAEVASLFRLVLTAL
jgi:PAS domain-containing protein